MFHSANYSAILISKAVAIQSFSLTLQHTPPMYCSSFSTANALANSLPSPPLQGFFHSHIRVTDWESGKRCNPWYLCYKPICSALPYSSNTTDLFRPTFYMVMPTLSPYPAQSSCEAQHHHFQRGNSQISVNTSSCLLLPVLRSISEFLIQIFCILVPRPLTPCDSVQLGHNMKTHCLLHNPTSTRWAHRPFPTLSAFKTLKQARNASFKPYVSQYYCIPIQPLINQVFIQKFRPPCPLYCLTLLQCHSSHFTHLDGSFLFVLKYCSLTVVWSIGPASSSIFYISFERTHP